MQGWSRYQGIHQRAPKMVPKMVPGVQSVAHRCPSSTRYIQPCTLILYVPLPRDVQCCAPSTNVGHGDEVCTPDPLYLPVNIHLAGVNPHVYYTTCTINTIILPVSSPIPTILAIGPTIYVGISKRERGRINIILCLHSSRKHG